MTHQETVADVITDSLEPPARHTRRGLLFITLAATMTIAFALSVISFAHPAGAGDELPGYATVQPMREFMWVFFMVAAVNLVIGVCAAAIAGWILTPTHGGRLATIGGALMWLGAALYGVGVGAWAAAYYVGTYPQLEPTIGAAVVDRVNHDAAHMLAVPLTGAALILLGSLLFSGGLWRARTLPRWIVVVGAASSLATFVVAPSTVAGVVAEGASSATTIAIGWYAWRRPACVGCVSTRVDSPRGRLE